VAGFFDGLVRASTRLYTSDYVLDETLTLLFKRMGSQLACAAVENLKQAMAKGVLSVERVDWSRFEKTLSMRLKYSDKPDISFTDLSSMVVMEKLAIKAIITADPHFQHVGKIFQIVP
jgi:predicted nucleic acid-binding protein